MLNGQTSVVYEIRIFGRLEGEYWSRWFQGMALAAEEDGTTVLRGVLADQAALYGLLARLRDLALPLVAVNRVSPRQSGSEHADLTSEESGGSGL